jgi:hypothetical protein
MMSRRCLRAHSTGRLIIIIIIPHHQSGPVRPSRGGRVLRLRGDLPLPGWHLSLCRHLSRWSKSRIRSEGENFFFSFGGLVCNNPTYLIIRLETGRDADALSRRAGCICLKYIENQAGYYSSVKPRLAGVLWTLPAYIPLSHPGYPQMSHD